MSAFMHFERLCEFGGRLAGSASERQAIDYARACLSDLAHGELASHPVTYDGWRALEASIEIDGGPLPVMPLPGSSSLPDGAAELGIVDAGRGTLADLDRHGGHLRGRAVVVTHEFMFAPDHVHRCAKLARALELGAALFVIANPRPGEGAVTGGVFPAMPAIGVDFETGERLRALARLGQPARFRLRTHIGPMQTETLDWSIAPTGRPDRDPWPEIIVSAHIDGHALAESAMDNASGVAVALAIAARHSAAPLRRHRLRVLIFSAEEFGLCGGAAYVAGLDAPQRRRIGAVFNLDCVGGSTSFGAMTSGFAMLETVARTAGSATGIDLQIHSPLLKNSDHYEFARVGIPAMRLIAGFGETEGRLRYVLTGRDRRDLVSENELAMARRLTETMIDLTDAGPGPVTL
ncbi:MAG: M28 family peptidase [Burkholderiaceae bacterium]